MTVRLKTFRTPGVKPYRHVALGVHDMTTPERDCWMFTNNGREVARAALVQGQFLLGSFDAQGNFCKLMQTPKLPDVENHFHDTSIALKCLTEGRERVREFVEQKCLEQVANADREPVYAPSPA